MKQAADKKPQDFKMKLKFSPIGLLSLFRLRLAKTAARRKRLNKSQLRLNPAKPKQENTNCIEI